MAPDEYDGLTAPLLRKLTAGDGRAEISEFLWKELEDHFGLSSPELYDVDAMADRLVAWWAAMAAASQDAFDRPCPDLSAIFQSHVRRDRHHVSGLPATG